MFAARTARSNLCFAKLLTALCNFANRRHLLQARGSISRMFQKKVTILSALLRPDLQHYCREAPARRRLLYNITAKWRSQKLYLSVAAPQCWIEQIWLIRPDAYLNRYSPIVQWDTLPTCSWQAGSRSNIIIGHKLLEPQQCLATRPFVMKYLIPRSSCHLPRAIVASQNSP